jgi:hypothetical protein
MLTPTEKRELEELREKAKTLDGLLYVGDALKYAQLLGQRGLTKPKIMLAARQHRLGAFQPTGGKWWVSRSPDLKPTTTRKGRPTKQLDR